MSSLKSVVDFAKGISGALSIQEKEVAEYFEMGTDEKGWFYARKLPKKWLERSQFVAMCALAKDFGGDYVKAQQLWRVPRPLVNKDQLPAAPQQASTATPTPSSSEPDHIVKDQPYRLFRVDDLLSGQFQSRLTFDDPEFEELLENVRVYGVLEPIIVRPTPSGKFEVVAGERRLAAAKKAGLAQIPGTLKELTDEEALVIQFTENLHRKDWTEEEKTRALGELAKRTRWNVQQIADKLKRSERWVYKYLPEEFKNKEMSDLGKLGGEATAESAAARRAPNSESQDTSKEEPSPETSKDFQRLPEHEGFKPERPERLSEQSETAPSSGDASLSPSEISAASQLEEPKPEPLDVAEFTCSECHQLFRIVHVNNQLHRFLLVNKEKRA